MTETRRNINSSTQIVFRHYMTYSKGQLEFVRPKCREIWMCDLGKMMAASRVVIDLYLYYQTTKTTHIAQQSMYFRLQQK